MTGYKFIRWMLCVIAVVMAAGGHAAQNEGSVSQLISQGVSTFQNAQDETETTAQLAGFKRAAQWFEQAARETPTPTLLANAGTAHLRAGDLGHATLAFKRALVLDAGEQRSRTTLAEIRATLPAWVPTTEADSTDSFFRWHTTLPLESRQNIALLACLLFALLFGLSTAFSIAWLRWLSLPFALVFIAALASTLMTMTATARVEAVVVAENAIARASDSANAQARFADALPPGTEVNVIEQRDRWVRVQLADNREGWMRQSMLALVDNGISGAAPAPPD